VSDRTWLQLVAWRLLVGVLSCSSFVSLAFLGRRLCSNVMGGTGQLWIGGWRLLGCLASLLLVLVGPVLLWRGLWRGVLYSLSVGWL
jgi:hypothetical protein